MNGLLRDIRYGLRMLRRSPGFTAVAVLTLALGIGATTMIFSVTNAVLLRPLPFPEPERLVWMWGAWGESTRASVSPPDFLDYRREAGSFERFSAMVSFMGSFPLTGQGEPEMVAGRLISADFFETLGWRPALGRGFTSEEEQVVRPAVVVLSDRLWRRRFGEDASIIGRAITLDGQSVTIVGVMPRGFDYPRGTDVWQPLPMRSPEFQARRAHFLRPIGRLREGVALETAQAEIGTIARRLEQQYPQTNTQWSLLLVPIGEPLVGGMRPALLLLMASVAAVLMISCANLANLLTSRAAARRKEVSIRAAMGASRRRIVRQLMTESLILAGLGGGLGLLLALWGVDLLRILSPAGLPRMDEVSIDLTVLAFAAGLSLLTAMVFGLVPALQTSRLDLHETLKEGGRTSAIVSHRRLRGALAVLEVAFSVILLIGAGLTVKSLWRLLDVKPGFHTGDLLTTRVTLPEAQYPRPEQRAFFLATLLERVGRLPGVVAAGAVSELPLSGQHNDTYFTVEGRPALQAGETRNANIRIVSPGYFRTMGIRLLKGRAFGPADTLDAPGVVVINEPLARLFFTGEDPIGRSLVIDLGEPYRAEIVGIVEGVRHAGLEWDPAPEMYLSHPQRPRSVFSLVVRAADDAASLSGSVRAAVWEIDRNLPVSEFVTMERFVDRAVAAPRFRTALLSLFAALALLLAVVGLYGVMSYSVSQRTHEIGLRMALGARGGDVVGLILAQGMRLTLAGVVIGLIASIGLARLASSLLFGVSASDLPTFIGVPVILTVVSLAACWLPARRAARVDPLVALRCE